MDTIKKEEVETDGASCEEAVEYLSPTSMYTRYLSAESRQKSKQKQPRDSEDGTPSLTDNKAFLDSLDSFALNYDGEVGHVSRTPIVAKTPRKEKLDFVMSDYGVPRNYDEAKSLPGVGPKMASLFMQVVRKRCHKRSINYSILLRSVLGLERKCWDRSRSSRT